jgi:hypothetical protein
MGLMELSSGRLFHYRWRIAKVNLCRSRCFEGALASLIQLNAMFKSKNLPNKKGRPASRAVGPFLNNSLGAIKRKRMGAPRL